MRITHRRALTVVELVIIIAIIGVSIAILIPYVRHAPVIPKQMVVVETPDSTLAPGATTNVSVLLSDSAGAPSRGARVTFTVTRGGGSVTPPATMTDSAGKARAAWNIGPDTGQKVLTVAAPDRAGVSVTISTAARTPHD